jgi:hypothetical protein
LYYEELDWGEQIRKNGFEIFYVHNSIVYHKASATTVPNSPLKIYYMNRGRLIFMRRNVNGITFLLALAYMIFVSLPKNLFGFLIKKEWNLAKSYLDSFFWNLKNSNNLEIFKTIKLP